MFNPANLDRNSALTADAELLATNVGNGWWRVTLPSSAADYIATAESKSAGTEVQCASKTRIFRWNFTTLIILLLLETTPTPLTLTPRYKGNAVFDDKNAKNYITIKILQRGEVLF